MQTGLITKIFDWGTHPANSKGDVKTWLAFLVLVLIAAFLWNTVIRQIQ